MSFIRRLLYRKHHLYLDFAVDQVFMINQLLDDLKQINLVHSYNLVERPNERVQFSIDFTETRGLYIFGNILAYRTIFPDQKTLQDYFNLMTK